MQRRNRYLFFGLTAVLVLVAATVVLAREMTVTSATGGGPEMKLSIKGVTPNPCVGATCTLTPGQAFTLAVVVVTGREGGYGGAQTWIEYGPNLVYNSAAAATEWVWAQCLDAIALAAPTPSGVGVKHGCLTGLLPPLPLSTATGNILELSFNCSAGNSSSEVELVPLGEDPALFEGAGFVGGSSEEQVAAKTTGLTINCGAGDQPTATPTGPTATPTLTPTLGPPTATPTITLTRTATGTPTQTPVPPTPTATPETLPGDVDGNGIVDSRDALLVLWLEAGLADLEDLANPEAAHLNDDGVINSIDALFILWIEAGAL